MTCTSIYRDIAARTDGAFMLGIVGPVRTGKSTFIKRFMEKLVIPQIDNTYMRERAKDELPQSGSGKSIMTAEPKFVPEEAVSITLDESTQLKVRLDAVTVCALTEELSKTCIGAKIDKVQQPERDMLIFHLRMPGANSSSEKGLYYD